MAASPPPGPLAGGHLHPPSTLRKSLSVDSFVALKGHAGGVGAKTSRSSGGHELDDTSSGSEPYSDDDEDDGQEWYGVAETGDLTFSRGPPARERADSDLDPYLDDSDHDRSERAIDISRMRATSNASSSSRELPLPARKKPSSPVPPVPPLPAATASQRPQAINTDVSQTSRLPAARQHDYVIAVVGAAGCGKSTVITKGLGSWGLSEAPLGVTIGPAGIGGRIEVSSRATTVGVSQTTSHTVQVLEVETSLLDYNQLGVWPVGMPVIDGVLVCYDASDVRSFAAVPALLRGYSGLGLSVVLLACKSERSPKAVTPQRASEFTSPYNIGLVEVSSETDPGKRKMRDCFNWLMKSIARARRGDQTSHVHTAGVNAAFRNPASPDILRSAAPWDAQNHRRGSREHTPRAPPPQPLPTLPTRRGSVAPPPGQGVNSPTRARSTNDLLAEARRVREDASAVAKRAGATPVSSPRQSTSITGPAAEEARERDRERERERERDERERERALAEEMDERNEDPYGAAGPESSHEALGGSAEDGQRETKEPAAIPFMTLDELLDKLLFFAVSGDDTTFIQHFFLTFRRFASPRAVLLGMQKRLRALSGAPSDMLLAKFAQMKICSVLEHWIQNYEVDFATPGAASALGALLKQLVMHIHTAHYGSDLLPFLDTIPKIRDTENAWYAPIEDAPQVEDEGSDYDEDQGLGSTESEDAGRNSKPPPASTDSSMSLGPPQAGPPRERASSFPMQSAPPAAPAAPPAAPANGSQPTLSVRAPLSMPPPVGSAGNSGQRASIKELQRIGQLLYLYDCSHVAEEITRHMLVMFMKIEPRQWLHHVATNKRDPKTDPIREFNVFYNYLSLWVASLILASDKPAKRVKQMERMVELAKQLRMQHNYSGLRCVLNGINMSKMDGDEVSELFKTRAKASWKVFSSYNALLSSSKMHRAYRTALKHTDGPAIPDMEIHTSDLRRAHESNIDFKDGDRTKIHWGKFALMGRLVNNVTMFQNRCRTSVGLDFPERPQLHQQLFSPSLVLMDSAMIDDRVGDPPENWDGSFGVSSQMDLNSSVPHESSGLKPARAARRLFFW